MLAGRTNETKERIIKSYSRLVADTLEQSIGHLNMIINDVQKENCGSKENQASKLYITK